MLCRVLKDNPDVQGNLLKIKGDKNDLLSLSEDLVAQLKDLSYANFKEQVNQGLIRQSQLEEYREREKKLMEEIRKI